MFSHVINMIKRCPWAEASELERCYHDEEWGVPVHDDQKLFEFLLLEGAQAGLSWRTILHKREAYSEAFDGFDPNKVAQYKEAKIKALLENKGIVRNELKIRSTVTNAQAFLKVQKEFNSFNNYLWGFVNNKQVKNAWKKQGDVPRSTELSDEISKDLKKRGFKFVGSTIVYAFLQAVGVVNDHLTNCPHYKRIK